MSRDGKHGKQSSGGNASNNVTPAASDSPSVIPVMRAGVTDLGLDAKTRNAAVSAIKQAIDRNPEFAAATFRIFMQT